jgi:prepilin-type N-terminal cleavage/methylation domain-containing protein
MRLLKSNKGFSLIEVIIVIALASAIFFVVASLRGNVSNLENLISQKLQSRQDVDQTFQILVTEIRSAGPSSLGAYPIVSAGTSTFVFYSDYDQDGIFERLRYTLGTSTVERGIVEPTGNPLVYSTSSEVVTTAIENVIVAATTSLDLFHFYDSNYTGSEAPMTSPISVADVRVVKIIVYADIAPGEAPKPVFFTNTVTIRNLRDN